MTMRFKSKNFKILMCRENFVIIRIFQIAVYHFLKHRLLLPGRHFFKKIRNSILNLENNFNKEEIENFHYSISSR